MNQKSPDPDQAAGEQKARGRSLATLAIFVAAMLVALVAPGIGFALICCALVSYLRPEAPSLRF
jgi:hypothetical protein